LKEYRGLERVTLRTPAPRLVCSTTFVACKFILRTI